MAVHFSNENKEIVSSSFNSDFKGVWQIPEGEKFMSIDVFELYKHNESDRGVFFMVWEGYKVRKSGNLMDCLEYIHKWR